MAAQRHFEKLTGEVKEVARTYIQKGAIGRKHTGSPTSLSSLCFTLCAYFLSHGSWPFGNAPNDCGWRFTTRNYARIQPALRQAFL